MGFVANQIKLHFLFNNPTLIIFIVVIMIVILIVIITIST